jgi:hypothetical protein
VLGVGGCERRWRRLAERLGIASSIEWCGWGNYSQVLPHYQWADVFAFTSLRDTSGAGLLDALAAGVPIVGVDHQGAADIMTDQCAIRVPVSGPAATIAGFRDAIVSLAHDGELLERLSRGALVRSREFHWDRQGEMMNRVYRQVRPGGRTRPRRRWPSGNPRQRSHRIALGRWQIRPGSLAAYLKNPRWIACKEPRHELFADYVVEHRSSH